MSAENVQENIKEIVDRETDAWNNKDTQKLLSIFHPDMVWPWPRTADSHDPVDWIFEVGRFDYQRWKGLYEEFFKSHVLIHNKRITQKIVISDQKDGAFAVVDVDTLWKNTKTQKDFLWKGRACKIYTKLGNGEWKLISHTGLLNYNI
jgi:ketosteroid isomerase-like protein